MVYFTAGSPICLQDHESRKLNVSSPILHGALILCLILRKGYADVLLYHLANEYIYPWLQVRVTNLHDASEHIGEVLKRVKKEHLERAYKIKEWYVFYLDIWQYKFSFCFKIEHLEHDDFPILWGQSGFHLFKLLSVSCFFL